MVAQSCPRRSLSRQHRNLYLEQNKPMTDYDNIALTLNATAGCVLGVSSPARGSHSGSPDSSPLTGFSNDVGMLLVLLDSVWFCNKWNNICQARREVRIKCSLCISRIFFNVFLILRFEGRDAAESSKKVKIGLTMTGRSPQDSEASMSIASVIWSRSFSLLFFSDSGDASWMSSCPSVSSSRSFCGQTGRQSCSGHDSTAKRMRSYGATSKGVWGDVSNVEIISD